MADAEFGVVLRHIRTLTARGGGAPTSDGELLRRFVSRRDEAAFAALVERHGPMVYGTAIKPVKGKRQDFPRFFRAGWDIGGAVAVRSRRPPPSRRRDG